MKISKKQLKEIIGEELEKVRENVRPDVLRTQKMMDTRGITKLVAAKINTWQELQGFLAGMLQNVQVKDNQKTMVLRKLLRQLQGPGGGSAPGTDAPAPEQGAAE